MNWHCSKCGLTWYAMQTPFDCLDCGNLNIEPWCDEDADEAEEPEDQDD